MLPTFGCRSDDNLEGLSRGVNDRKEIPRHWRGWVTIATLLWVLTGVKDRNGNDNGNGAGIYTEIFSATLFVLSFACVAGGRDRGAWDGCLHGSRTRSGVPPKVHPPHLQVSTVTVELPFCFHLFI